MIFQIKEHSIATSHFNKRIIVGEIGINRYGGPASDAVQGALHDSLFSRVAKLPLGAEDAVIYWHLLKSFGANNFECTTANCGLLQASEFSFGFWHFWTGQLEPEFAERFVPHGHWWTHNDYGY